MSSGEHSASTTGVANQGARLRWAVPVVISGIVLAALACGTYLFRRAEANVNQVALSDNPKAVTVVEARATTFRPTHRYVGTLEPWLYARVGPQLASGYVDTVLVRPGTIVKRGAVLATLDCRNVSAASQAIAHQARALEEKQKAAAREAKRLGELLDGGYAAPNEVEQKQAQSAAHEAQLAALLAQGSGKALEVNDCVLRAPFDGEVSLRLADPGTFARPGTGIVEVVDRSVVRLAASVPEIDFDAVAPKTPVRIRLLATNKEISGEVARRAPSAEPNTRTVRFEVDLPNATRDIPVGTTAEIYVDVGEAAPVVEIPLLAAKIRGTSATVFVVEDGVAKKLSVDIVGERGANAFVSRETLKPGMRVVTQGRSLLAHNDRVEAKLEAPKGEASK
ncbi:MAG TPA: efflux RND transporter periplasmic adaptor subunit [Labilithrix sp.]|nr:efflux RND transporter periplasmic adaptor subunit [Labilithrix sp.]